MSDQHRQANLRIESIPLERPVDWSRRRDVPKLNPILPYFITGNENQLAVFVSQSLSHVLPDGNPILIVGVTGSGKTSMVIHLATRISQYLRNQNSSTSAENPTVLYTTSNDFHREYTENVAADLLQSMREKIHKAEIWIVEDLHHLQEKHRAQEELASRIESRTLEGKITLLTSDRRPCDLSGMRADFCSRCVAGLTLPMMLPDCDARQQIITELMIRHHLELSDQLLSDLLQSLESNLSVRALDHLIRSIDLWCRANSAEPNHESISHAINSAIKNQSISLSMINAAVAKYFKIQRSGLRGSSRKQAMVRARSLAMLIARQLTDKTMLQIGDFYGGRDHTTVLHAIRSTEERLKNDDSLSQALSQIKHQLSR